VLLLLLLRWPLLLRWLLLGVLLLLRRLTVLVALLLILREGRSSDSKRQGQNGRSDEYFRIHKRLPTYIGELPLALVQACCCQNGRTRDRFNQYDQPYPTALPTLGGYRIQVLAYCRPYSESCLVRFAQLRTVSLSPLKGPARTEPNRG
jgi:hypothetical protein